MLSLFTQSFTRIIGKSRSLSAVFLPLFMFLLAVFPALSTDMYLPALSLIAENLHANERIINLTVVFFFVFFGIAILFWGPLSDRIGRKSALLIGIAIYIIATVGCMLATTANHLIAMRIGQSIGAAAPFSIVFSLVHDHYQGENKKRMLALLSSAMMIAPVVAPSLGSVVLVLASWRVIFALLLLLGGASFIGSLFLEKHNCNGMDVAASDTNTGLFSGLFKLMRNRLLLKVLILFSMPATFLLGFVGASALVFMVEFGLSKEAFSLFFAINAIFSILGSLLSVKVSKMVSFKILLTICFLGLALSGLSLLVFGRTDPHAFLLCLVPGTFLMALIRPLTVYQMMNMAGSDPGATSSLINFLFSMFGCIGMYVVTLHWDSIATAFGIMTFIVGLLCLFIWQIISRDPFLREL